MLTVDGPNRLVGPRWRAYVDRFDPLLAQARQVEEERVLARNLGQALEAA